MVQVQVISDLHLESPKAYDSFEIEAKAPYLALLGDIGNVEIHKSDFFAFLKKQLKQFSAVLFVPGNHEAYYSSWPATLKLLQAFEDDVRNDHSITSQFILLDRKIYCIPPDDPRVAIVGCSLFSAVPPADEMSVSLGLNDFYVTKDWDVAAHNAAHERDLAWLNQTVEDLQDRVDNIMIVSHWCPSRDARASAPQHANSRITTGFSTDLSREKCFTSPNVKVWAFGHTHYNCDFVVERENGHSLRLLANQRGYYFAQAKGFDATRRVEMSLAK